MLGLFVLFGCNEADTKNDKMFNQLLRICARQMQDIKITDNLYCVCRAEMPIDFVPTVEINKPSVPPYIKGKTDFIITLDCHRKIEDRKYVPSAKQKK